MANETVKKPVYKRWWFWVLAIFVLPVLIGSIGSSGTNKPADAPTEAVTPIVDAPHLLGLTIDQARKELGTPDDGAMTEPNKDQLSSGLTKTWTNEFTIGDYGILLEYDLKTREITRFFISPNHDEVDGKGNRDWQKLAKLANLSSGSTDSYTVKPIQTLMDPSYYTGVAADEK